MRLRIILLVLSLLAVLSVTSGSYFYFSVIRDAAFQEAERQAKMRLEGLTKTIASFLTDNTRVVRALAGMEELANLLLNPGPDALQRTNAVLDHFNRSLEADVCYLMDHHGNTIASSNRRAPDSFVGQNFAFRPYFQNAIRGWPTSYLALGITSRKRGVYNSYPITVASSETPVGVAVIKSSIDVIENRLGLTSDDLVLVTDPRGVIFISNRGDWLFKRAWEIPEEAIQRIAAERQFGAGPWEWVGLTAHANGREATLAGDRYLMHQVEIDGFPGWKVVHLRSASALFQAVYGPILRVTGPVVISLCLLIAASVLVLYRNASQEITRRRQVEKALRESEERYRSLYHNTPAMLHSIDTDGRLVSVSDYWEEALGYKRPEVIGRKLTDFMTPESRRYAEETVFPQFFRTGFCKDVAYRFIAKNRSTIDVLLSAIADRDNQGRIVRTLAVSVDVTRRRQAEEALRQAKEALSRYSKDLERQVQLRTREIGSILKYTPAVVYFKDIEGRYLLVNSRYEELFGVRNDAIRGRTDHEILPPEVAEQFRAHDREVLADHRSRQVEERIPQPGGIRTYLSVKFPVFDETGKPRGVCGIATDITAVKKAQDQLRRLSGSILANQEKERAAIARELHDELGQVLTALRMEAVWIQERMRHGNEESVPQRAEAMCRLIDKTIGDVRSMAFRLRPGILDDLGLVDALEQYTTDFEKRSGIPCVFDCREEPPVPETVATAAYRITQEALTNVIRHADAGRVEVRLGRHNGHLLLTVEDDGRGFSPDGSGDTDGLGLAGMRERAVLVGGILEIDSRPGAGTRIRFRVPCKLDSGEAR